MMKYLILLSVMLLTGCGAYSDSTDYKKYYGDGTAKDCTVTRYYSYWNWPEQESTLVTKCGERKIRVDGNV